MQCKHEVPGEKFKEKNHSERRMQMEKKPMEETYGVSYKSQKCKEKSPYERRTQKEKHLRNRPTTSLMEAKRARKRAFTAKSGRKATEKKPIERKAKSGRKRAFMRDERKSEETCERNPLMGGENP